MTTFWRCSIFPALSVPVHLDLVSFHLFNHTVSVSGPTTPSPVFLGHILPPFSLLLYIESSVHCSHVGLFLYPYLLLDEGSIDEDSYQSESGTRPDQLTLSSNDQCPSWQHSCGQLEIPLEQRFFPTTKWLPEVIYLLPYSYICPFYVSTNTLPQDLPTLHFTLHLFHFPSPNPTSIA